MIDIYQQRYLEHIQRKKQTFAVNVEQGTRDKPKPELPTIIRDRHSQRTFSDMPLTMTELNILYKAARLAPSSCNRQAITLKPIVRANEKDQLEEWLVGGRKWIGKAFVILLLFADMQAYKSPVERDFMPYLDAGFMASTICLAATGLGVGACYVNPNIRQANKEAFDALFNSKAFLFCGAVALGNYSREDIAPPKRDMKGLFY